MWIFVFTTIWLGVMSVADIRRRRVPIWLLISGGIVVTIVSVSRGLMGEGQLTGLVMGMLPGSVMLLTASTRAAGWADGAVLSVLGLLWGFRQCAVSFVLSMLAISVVSLVLLAFRKADKKTKLPYLPFLCGGYLFQAIIGLAV